MEKKKKKMGNFIFASLLSATSIYADEPEIIEKITGPENKRAKRKNALNQFVTAIGLRKRKNGPLGDVKR